MRLNLPPTNIIAKALYGESSVGALHYNNVLDPVEFRLLRQEARTVQYLGTPNRVVGVENIFIDQRMLVHYPAATPPQWMNNLMSAVNVLSKDMSTYQPLFLSTTAFGVYHNYPQDGFMSPHPDPKHFVNFILMLGIDGLANVKAGLSATNMEYNFDVGPNSAVLLRAPFPGEQIDRRPYHQVQVKNGPRRSVVVRQKLRN